jgi:hypothetical protein
VNMELSQVRRRQSPERVLDAHAIRRCGPAQAPGARTKSGHKRRARRSGAITLLAPERWLIGVTASRIL